MTSLVASVDLAVTYKIMMKLNIVVFLISLIPFASNAENLEEYLENNNKIVTDYLKYLDVKEIGNAVNGIALTDKTMILDKHVFLGRNNSLQNGLNIYMFRTLENETIAYIWLTTGKPFELLSCEGVIVGGGTYVLSGDVYTWKKLQPGHGVVKYLCPPESWLK